MLTTKKKPAAQIAPALKAARLKAQSKAKPSQPPSDNSLRQPESSAPVAIPISASPRQPRAPPRRFHFDRRAAELAAIEGSDDDLLTTREAADWFRCSVQWLEIGRSKGYGPPFVRLGPKCVRYRRGAVRQWLIERTHLHTREYQI
jgi:hypothetical protein